MTKLSIIIPVYNEGPYLKRCLDSIRVDEQDLHDVEIIVIDDGSTDGSREICDEYDMRVGFRIFHHSTQWGVGMTRNDGIIKATGEFVTFLDSDDEMSEDGIAHMVTGCLADFDIVQYNHWRVSSNGFKDMRYYNDPHDVRINELPKKWVLVWNKVYRKDFILKNRIQFPADLSFEEDRIFNIRCFRHEPTFHCGKAGTVLKHFDNKRSLCHTVGRDQVFGIAQALEKELKNKDNSPELERVIRQCLADTWSSKTAIRLFGGET